MYIIIRTLDYNNRITVGTEYCIAETFEGELSHGLVRSDHFVKKKSRNAKTYHGVGMVCPNFVEETFVGGSKTVKFVNIFYLESFRCTVLADILKLNFNMIIEHFDRNNPYSGAIVRLSL